MNYLKQINWVLSVIFYNLRLIAEDILIDPLLKKLSILKPFNTVQKDHSEPKQLPQAYHSV